MKRRALILSAIGALAGGLAFAPLAAESQQGKGVPRIGYLSAVSLAASSTRSESFRRGLRELGHIEGKNIAIEWRFAEGKPERVRELATELVGLKVDVIVAAGSSASRAAKQATSTIPIVMAQVADPVGSGLVASLARPGGNATGTSTIAPEISGKRLELLKELVPGLARVAVIGTSDTPGNAEALREAERAAGALGLRLQYLDVLAANDIEGAFQSASKARADAAIVLASPFSFSERRRVAQLAAAGRLPVMYWSAEFAEAGGLMSYGVNYTELYRRAATFVDKILKGARPADLPVERPTKFELVVNLRTARNLDLTIPSSLLARADRVIE